MRQLYVPDTNPDTVTAPRAVPAATRRPGRHAQTPVIT
jgi:hypothetical protein